MSRILLVWQLGGNLGHITRLRTLGRSLRARGHEVTFAFEDMRGAAQLIAEGFFVVQAPILRQTILSYRGTRMSSSTVPRSPLR